MFPLFLHHPTKKRICWCSNSTTANFVNLTVLREAQIGGKEYFWVCLWGGFWKRFDSVDWVKGSTLTNVGEQHPIHWEPKWNKNNSLSSWAGTPTFSCPQISEVLILKFWLWTENYTTGSPGSQAFRLTPGKRWQKWAEFRDIYEIDSLWQWLQVPSMVWLPLPPTPLQAMLDAPRIVCANLYFCFYHQII